MGIKRLKKSRTIRVLIKRDIERQADRHTNSLFSLKSMVLVMTKTFNIIHIFFLSGFSSHKNSRITGLQRKGDIALTPE